MSDTYEINDRDEVIPYTSGRRCNNARAWRDATELEIQQRDKIARLESEVEKLEAKIDDLREIHSLPNAEITRGDSR
jgi:cell division protein FtsB